MNKHALLVIFTSLLALVAVCQSPRVDTVAVSLLDKMSNMIGSMNSCAVTVNSNYDIPSRRLGLIKHSDEEQLFLHGPDKMLVRTEGDKGTRYISYDGKTLTCYSLDRNQYGQVTAPASIVSMIDTINRVYGIDFPAADIFYPSFVDDILADSKGLEYLGLTKVRGMECFHIAGIGKDKTFQFWIANDAYYLPIKIVIVYTNKPMNPQYEAVLTDWKVNPDLPDALFEFSAPPKAKKIKMTQVVINQ
ncbi:MAG TPA: DUF2092 domain-containing protein [Puia sp.]|nr:DUF2092 domain-containing protein [Puia sp.]